MNHNITPPYFVEVLTRDKQLKTRHRFEQLPITIGRSYNNDLILDDPYIAPNHAVIELSENNEAYIRDLNSENGLIAKGKRQPQITLDSDVVRLGHTNIRFRHAGFQVKETLTDKASHNWEGWPPATAGFFMIALSVLGSAWLGASEKFSMISAVTTLSLVLVLMLLWSGGWAFATRIVTGGSLRFGRHLFIAACAAILVDFWDIISVTLAYVFSLEFLTLYGSHIAIAIAAGMIFFHLMTINDQHRKRYIVICTALAMIGSSFILISNYQRNGKLSDSLYMTSLLPPVLRISGNQSTEDFFDDAKALKPKLDKAREKPANQNRGLFGN